VNGAGYSMKTLRDHTIVSKANAQAAHHREVDDL
jgi:hypothetical protein